MNGKATHGDAFYCDFSANTYLEEVLNIEEDITSSSNARTVPFEYPYIYLNKKEKVCKARVNE
jgi:hypothetical protein